MVNDSLAEAARRDRAHPARDEGEGGRPRQERGVLAREFSPLRVLPRRAASIAFRKASAPMASIKGRPKCALTRAIPMRSR
jgi:hypothetical protein